MAATLTGLSVVRTAPITSLKVDDTGEGFDLSLLNPESFVSLKKYCNEAGYTQFDLEQLHARFASNIIAPRHPDGSKKKCNTISIQNFQESFDHMCFENVSLLFMQHLFQHEVEVDLATFTISSFDFACKHDFELLLSFFDCLLPSYNIDPVTVIQMDAFLMIIESVHTKITPELQLLLNEMPNGALTLAEIIRYAFFFPPLFYPVIEFGRSFRRRVMGNDFWKDRIRKYENVDFAGNNYMLSRRECSVFDYIDRMEDAWHVAAHHVLLKLKDGMRGKQKHDDTKVWETQAGNSNHKNRHGSHKKHHHVARKRGVSKSMLRRLKDLIYPQCLQLDFDTVHARGHLRDKYGLRIGTWIFSLLGVKGNDGVCVEKVLMPLRHLSLPWQVVSVCPKWSWVRDKYEKIYDASSGYYFWRNGISGETAWYDPLDSHTWYNISGGESSESETNKENPNTPIDKADITTLEESEAPPGDDDTEQQQKAASREGNYKEVSTMLAAAIATSHAPCIPNYRKHANKNCAYLRDIYRSFCNERAEHQRAEVDTDTPVGSRVGKREGLILQAIQNATGLEIQVEPGPAVVVDKCAGEMCLVRLLSFPQKAKRSCYIKSLKISIDSSEWFFLGRRFQMHGEDNKCFKEGNKYIEIFEVKELANVNGGAQVAFVEAAGERGNSSTKLDGIFELCEGEFERVFERTGPPTPKRQIING